VQGVVALQRPYGEARRCGFVYAGVSAQPCGDGLGISGGADAKSRPLVNVLFVVPGTAALKVIWCRVSVRASAFPQGFWGDVPSPVLAAGLAGSVPCTCISTRRTFMSASSAPVSAPGMPAAILLIIVARWSIIPLRCRA
jgi:hypothetical protein